MTLQEKELLTQFLQQLVSAQAGRKDVEAEALIKEAVARQPDAAYLLAQRALQLEQLLQASQEQLKTLQAQVEQGGTGSTDRFLDDPNAWGSRRGVGGRQPIPGQRAAPATAARPERGGSWASGLFGNIASTAAGVVAGSFLFQGIQGLMNRGESDQLAGGALPAEGGSEQAGAGEPELLNSYTTPEAEPDSTSLADFGDSSDFV